MSYNKYPKEMKEAIIARMLEGDETVTDIQRDTGVGINTLYRWRDQAKHQKGLSATTKYKNADKWSSQDKFMVVLETANLTEIEFSEYSFLITRATTFIPLTETRLRKIKTKIITIIKRIIIVNFLCIHNFFEKVLVFFGALC